MRTIDMPLSRPSVSATARIPSEDFGIGRGETLAKAVGPTERMADCHLGYDGFIAPNQV
jgi:hypothetical protein